MIAVLAQSVMRTQVGKLELAHLFSEREKLNAGITMSLDEATIPWGIRVFRYEIQDIVVNKDINLAMERQSNAERVKRADILQSEGHRRSTINEAEGTAESVRLKAEAEAKSIKMIAEAEAARTKMIAEADAAKTRMNALATAEAIKDIGQA